MNNFGFVFLTVTLGSVYFNMSILHVKNIDIALGNRKEDKTPNLMSIRNCQEIQLQKSVSVGYI